METQGARHCPKCGMELLEFSYQRIRIDQCAGCDGIWLDKGELEEVERRKRGLLLSIEFISKWGHAMERAREAGQPVVNQWKSRFHMRCPACGSGLDEVEKHGIQVDRCIRCGGVWLDSGELESIAGVEHGLLARLQRFIHG